MLSHRNDNFSEKFPIIAILAKKNKGTKYVAAYQRRAEGHIRLANKKISCRMKGTVLVPY